MNPEIQYLLSSSVNVFLITTMNMITQVYALTHFFVLKRRNSMVSLYLYSILRVILINALMQNVLSYYYGEAPWWGGLCLTMSLISTLSYITICYWIFEEDLLKLILILLFSELPIGFYNAMFSAFISMIYGRNFSWVYYYPLRWDIIVIFAVGAILYLIVIRKIIPFLEKLIGLLLQHRKILWILIMIYLYTSFLSWVYVDSFKLISFFIALYFCAFLIAILYFVQSYITNIRRRNDFLREQKEIVEIHCNAIIRQIAQMKKSQEIMNEQMKEMSGQTDDDLKKERMVSYINQLKDFYHEIKAGIYCDDWLLDAALYHRAQEFEKKKISFSVLMQGYDRGNIEEKDLVQMIMELLDHGEEKLEGKERKGDHVLTEELVITLKLCRMKNQLLIDCSYPFSKSKKDKKLKKRLRYYLKKYSGTCNEILQNGQHTVVITLKAI